MILKKFVTGPVQTNTYVVSDGITNEALVIDPGIEIEQLLVYIGHRGLRVTSIINTHGHFDHVSGNRRVQEATLAPILIHQADAGLSEKAAQLAGLIRVQAESSPPADCFLADGAHVKVGTLAFQIIHTPGHTPGGVSLAGNGVIFCGDLLYHGSSGKTDLPGCSEKDLIYSIINRVLTLPDETIIHPGHGNQTTVGKEKPNYK